MAELPVPEISRDHLLGGKLIFLQPQNGYRVAIDPLFLAAAVPARPGDQILDAGCGAGAAVLALGWRVPGCSLTGLELQSGLAGLAGDNAALNGQSLTLWQGDMARPDAIWPRNSFDHVLTNPPYQADGTPPPHPGRALAHLESSLDLAGWIGRCLTFLKPKGCLTLIQRADRLDTILSALHGRAGAAEVIPLWPKAGVAAKRVIIRARKGRRTALTLHPGMILHQDDGRPTAAADAILRGGESLDAVLASGQSSR